MRKPNELHSAHAWVSSSLLLAFLLVFLALVLASHGLANAVAPPPGLSDEGRPSLQLQLPGHLLLPLLSQLPLLYHAVVLWLQGGNP